MNVYYVYVYLDPRKPGEYEYGQYNFDFEPFYIGKGKGLRMFHHLKEKDKRNPIKSNKIKKIIEEGFTPIIIQYKSNLSSNEAEQLEIDLIKVIGRITTKDGPLTNIRPGGQGEKIYTATSEEQKEKISKSVSKYWEENSHKLADRNKKIAISKKQKYDEGRPSPFKNRRWVHKPGEPAIVIKEEEIDKYLSIGYLKGKNKWERNL